MTDQEIVAGGGEIAQASGTLGLNVYSDWEFISVLQTFYSFSGTGQGSGAVAWLSGNFLGGTLDQIAQLWDNNGTLGLNLYAPFENGTLASFPDLGQGSGAVAWLSGDFTGSGSAEIAQLWDNHGHLGLNVYRMGETPQTVISSSDLGQGSGAVAWLTGDFTGSGHTEIAQLWDNGGSLAVNIYGMPGGTVTVHYRSDLGQGSGALAWLTGDFTGSGHTEIAQLWDNNGTLALIVYSFVNAIVQTVISSSDLDQGTSAVAWLTGDFTGSGRTEIAQLWDNDGTLGAVIYGCVNGTAETLFGSSDLGQGSGAVAWLTGTFTSSGIDEIVQLWDNNGTLSYLHYGYSNGSLTTLWFGGDLGQGPGALAWLTGNFTGSGYAAIAQLWAS